MHTKPGWQTVLQAAVRAATPPSTWARVEGGVHYPSDLLVGMALGHFVAALIDAVFMGLNDPAIGALDLSMPPQSLSIGYWWKF
jgi:H+/Cl- antiporter ClcA